MSTYSVQFGTMQEAASGLKAVYDKLSAIGTDLEQMVQQGTVEFQGNTKDDFMVAQAKYEQAHQELAMSLNNAVGVLEGIHENYGDAERRGTQLWAK
jgi:WXG100 family type VII secretion target